MQRIDLSYNTISLLVHNSIDKLLSDSMTVRGESRLSTSSTVGGMGRRPQSVVSILR